MIEAVRIDEAVASVLEKMTSLDIDCIHIIEVNLEPEDTMRLRDALLAMDEGRKHNFFLVTAGALHRVTQLKKEELVKFRNSLVAWLDQAIELNDGPIIDAPTVRPENQS